MKIHNIELLWLFKRFPRFWLPPRVQCVSMDVQELDIIVKPFVQLSEAEEIRLVALWHQIL